MDARRNAKILRVEGEMVSPPDLQLSWLDHVSYADHMGAGSSKTGSHDP